MKHITYTPKENSTIAYQRAGHLVNDEQKNAIIFHNVIAINAKHLSIKEFQNSFNDIDVPDYLEPDYKEKVMLAYWDNQREFPNEDLMCFNHEIFHSEKVLIAKYTKNEEMLARLSQDDYFSIREILASRLDLPNYIVDKLINDPLTSVHKCLAKNYPLSKEQIKRLAKENNSHIAELLFSNPNIDIDDKLINYFVKYGSQKIKEELVRTRQPLTHQQIEYLLTSAPNNIDIKCSLAMFYDLPEKTLLNLLDTRKLKLLSKIASRGDLTIPMIDKLLAKNDDSLKLDLIFNNSLISHSTKTYEYLLLKALREKNIAVIKEAMRQYILNFNKDLKLSSDLLLYLVDANYKNGDKDLANLILHISDIPQYIVERVAFDGAINYLFYINFNGIKEYYNVGAKTPYFPLVLTIKDYVTKADYVKRIPCF